MFAYIEITLSLQKPTSIEQTEMLESSTQTKECSHMYSEQQLFEAKYIKFHDQYCSHNIIKTRHNQIQHINCTIFVF